MAFTDVVLHSVFQKNISHFLVVHFSIANESLSFSETLVTNLPTVQAVSMVKPKDKKVSLKNSRITTTPKLVY